MFKSIDCISAQLLACISLFKSIVSSKIEIACGVPRSQLRALIRVNVRDLPTIHFNDVS